MPLCFRCNRQSVDYSFFIFLPNFSSLLPHLCNNTCRLIVALFFRNLTLFQYCLATQRQHHAAAMDSWLIVAIAVNFSSPHCPLIAVAVLLHEELCQGHCLWATIDSKLMAAFFVHHFSLLPPCSNTRWWIVAIYLRNLFTLLHCCCCLAMQRQPMCMPFSLKRQPVDSLFCQIFPPCCCHPLLHCCCLTETTTDANADAAPLHRNAVAISSVSL